MSRPIIFTADSICAILDGRKTVTRRVIKPQPSDAWQVSPVTVVGDRYSSNGCVSDLRCPYGQQGDLLRMQSAWTLAYDERLNEAHWHSTRLWMTTHGRPTRVDGKTPLQLGHHAPSHMPEWLSVAQWPLLRVVDVRAERLSAITEEDAKREGIEQRVVRASPPLHSEIKYVAPGVKMRNAYGEIDLDAPAFDSARAAFRELWDSINAKRGYPFDFDPWVWRVEFVVLS